MTASRWALRAVAALTVLPLWLSSHPPLSDLPEHLAVIATLHRWSDPSYASQAYFTFDGLAGTPYLLYHVAAALLAFILGSAERANLVLLTLVGLAVPYALRELLRVLGRDERLAIVGCPLFWNRALAEGLVNYVAAIPLVLWGLAVAVRHADRPSRGRGIGLAAMGLALVYLHPCGLLVFALGAIAVVLATPARPRRLAARLGWLAPALVVSAAIAATQAWARLDPALGPRARIVRFAPPLARLAELPGWIADFWTSPSDEVVFAQIALAFAAYVLLPRRGPRREGRFDPRGAALLAVAVVLYFGMPSHLGFGFLLDLRFAVFVALCAAIAAPRRDDAAGTRCTWAMTAAAAVLALHGSWQMRAYETEEAAHFDRVLRNLPRGKKVLALVFARNSARAVVSPFVHFGAYYRVRDGGVASFSYAELPHWPVRYRPEAAPPKKDVVFWDWSPCLFRNSQDGPYYDFVLARGEVDPFAGRPRGPRWTLVGGARDWKLWGREEGEWSGEGRRDDGPCVARPRS